MSCLIVLPSTNIDVTYVCFGVSHKLANLGSLGVKLVDAIRVS